MDIKVLSSNAVHSNMYILEHNGRAIIIDPSISDYNLTNCKVEYLILTHEHYDHISAVNYWKERTGADVIASSSCQKGLQNPARNFSRFFKEFCNLQTMIKVEENIENQEYICYADITFDKEFSFIWNGYVFNLFEIPGHSKGSIYISVNNKVLFCGDTLFRDFPIATGLPGGSKKQWVSISKPILEKLPKDIIVYPGHFQSFILGEYKFWEMV